MKHLSVMVVGACLLAQVACRADDSAAVKTLEKEGAFVERDDSLPGNPLRKVTYNLLQVTDNGLLALKEIENLPAIEFIGAGDTELNVSTLRALQDKKSLKRLSLSYAKVGDECAKVFRKLKSLEALDLQVQVTCSPASLDEIVGAANLKEVTLSDRLVTNAALKGLQNLPDLHTLNLRSLTLTDDGLAALKRLRGLQTLRVFLGPEITPMGLRHLAQLDLRKTEITYFNVTVANFKALTNLNSLTSLRLMNAKPITDDLVPVFGEFTKLKELELVGASLTKSGSKQLRSTIPDCKIIEGNQ